VVTNRTEFILLISPNENRLSVNFGIPWPSAHGIPKLTPGDMNTRLHQEAFPREYITDRPLPEASVPGLYALIEGGYPSGRYQARSIS
jgi:hypothetical protein